MQPLKPPRREETEDLQTVQSTLSRLKREKEELEQKERQEFEAQNKKLWSSIEGAITAAEESTRKREKEEAERIAAARKTQEEAERKAKVAREEQEKRARDEKEANDLRTQKEQERKKAEEEKSKATQQAKEEAAKTKEAMKSFGVGDALNDQGREDYQRWSAKMKVSRSALAAMKWLSLKHAIASFCPTARQGEGPACDRREFGLEKAVFRRQATDHAQDWTIDKLKSRDLAHCKSSGMAKASPVNPRLTGVLSTQTSTISSLLKEAQAASSPNQEIYQWVLNHLSKCLIRQAEQEVAVKVDTAYPLARVVIWLLLDGHEKLGEILMARLVKKSCWCLGYVPEKRPVSRSPEPTQADIG